MNLNSAKIKKEITAVKSCKLPVIVIIMVFLLVSGILYGQKEKVEDKIHKFKIGILYINSPTGKRFREGILEANKAYSSYSKNGKFEFLNFPYNDEKDGLAILTSIIKSKNGNDKKKIDIILGPTESDVFLRAIEQRRDLEVFEIPVISSQVASKIPHQSGGWFFRTNINVERRAMAIYDFLNKYWVHSITVLYADTEFGRRAEEAFRGELQGKQRKLYLPLSYDSTGKARSQIRQILAQRPEAVGIFGNRIEIAELYNFLRNLNGGFNPYQPLTFSLIDNRFTGGELKNNYFVSVTDIANNKDYDDVKALAFDTTLIVLKELDMLAGSKNFTTNDFSWRKKFRNRFECILDGNSNFDWEDSQIKNKTGIYFRDFENNTTPKVFRLNGTKVTHIDLERTVGLFKKINHKLNLIWDRFGFIFVFNIFLILILVIVVTTTDLKRWYEGKLIPLLRSFHFWLLVLLNVTIALVIYFFLGELGSIRYNSIPVALIIAITPNAIFRATLIETPTGRAIGLSKYYDLFLSWIHEKLTIRKNRKWQLYINVIAYNNTVDGMKNELNKIYDNYPNKEHRIRVKIIMENKLKEAESWIERRKIMARLLLQKFTVEHLEKCKLAPEGLSNEKDETRDPDTVIIEAARYCAIDKKREEKVDELIKKLLERHRDNRYKDLWKVLDQDIESLVLQTPIAVLRKKFGFLFALRGYEIEFLKENDLIPEEEKSEPAPEKKTSL